MRYRSLARAADRRSRAHAPDARAQEVRAKDASRVRRRGAWHMACHTRVLPAAMLEMMGAALRAAMRVPATAASESVLVKAAVWRPAENAAVGRAAARGRRRGFGGGGAPPDPGRPRRPAVRPGAGAAPAPAGSAGPGRWFWPAGSTG